MAIHNVDKTGETRDAPKANVHDSMGNAPRMAHGTNSVNYVTDTTDPTLIEGILGGNFRYIQSGVATITVPTPQGTDLFLTETISHNLGYVPSYIVYVTPPPGFSSGLKQRTLVPFFYYVYFDSLNTPSLAGFHINGVADISILDDTTIQFYVGIASDFGIPNETSGVWTFQYYLGQQAAS